MGLLLLAMASTIRAGAPWADASHSYSTALKVYKLGDWKKAQAAFAEFVQKYPGHQNVPLAYLQLAHCRSVLKDWKGRQEAVETVIEKFPESKAAKYAFGHQLAVLRSQKNYDAWLDLLEKISKQTRQIPLNYSGRLDWRRNGDYWWRFSNTMMHFPHVRQSGYRLNIAPGLGWANEVLTVADTPLRALRALDILDPTLKHAGNDLPANWKYAHVELLRRAGTFEDDPKDTSKEAQSRRLRIKRARRPAAEEQLKAYLDGWPAKDPRKMGLMLLLAEQAQAAGDDAEANRWYAQLLEEYPAYSTLGNRLKGRLTYLYEKQRYNDFVALARWYLKHYPIGGLRDDIVRWWIALVTKGLPESAEQIPVVLKVLEKEEAGYAKNIRRLKKGLQERLELFEAAGQTNQLVPLAKKMLSKDYWCAESFQQIEELAKKHEALKPVLAEARKQFVIPVEDPKSPAKKQYDELQQRIKANQTRHMEEIGRELLDAHPKDPWTIKTLHDLVNYYYQKVLIEPRDRWVAAMMENYPRHPLTQAVVDRQIKAVGGAKNFSELARLTEWAMQQFPGANRWDGWMNSRMESFTATKDYPGASQYGRDAFGPRAAAGELAAIAKMIEYDNAGLEQTDMKSRGNRWRQEAKQWKGKPQELYCLRNAFHEYYVTPVSRWWWDKICFNEAAETAQELNKSKFDPELAWRLEFEPVNMRIQSGDAVAAARQAMKTIKEVKDTFQIAQRLDLYNLGWTLGKAKLSGKAQRLLIALKNRCKLPSDQYAFKVMLGNLFEAEGKHDLAAKFYLMAGDDLDWPIDAWPLVNEAGSGLRRDPYSAAMMRYAGSIKSAQDLVPRILSAVARRNLGSVTRRAKALALVKLLRSKYASSGYRGQVEAALQKK